MWLEMHARRIIICWQKWQLGNRYLQHFKERYQKGTTSQPLNTSVFLDAIYLSTHYVSIQLSSYPGYRIFQVFWACRILKCSMQEICQKSENWNPLIISWRKVHRKEHTAQSRQKFMRFFNKSNGSLDHLIYIWLLPLRKRWCSELVHKFVPMQSCLHA